MLEARSGDVVFSFDGAEIRAIGVVLERPREAAKPKEFAAVGDQWGDDLAWQWPLRF